MLTVFYASGSAIFSVAAILWQGGDFAATVNGGQVAIGLLLLGVWSSTSLSEERVRGSLDLLMSSPLSAWQIVKGKWLGAFRAAPLLAFLPCTVIGSIAYTADRSVIGAVCFLLIYVMFAGGAVTSLGLLMAIWFSRVGRAVSVTVAVYASVTVVWLFLVTTVFAGPDRDGSALASPFFCVGKMTFDFGRRGEVRSTNGRFSGRPPWLSWALSMLGKAARDFDRRLGRVEEPLVRLGRPSPAARVAGLLYICVFGLPGVRRNSLGIGHSSWRFSSRWDRLLLQGSPRRRQSVISRAAPSAIDRSAAYRPRVSCSRNGEERFGTPWHSSRSRR